MSKRKIPGTVRRNLKAVFKWFELRAIERESLRVKNSIPFNLLNNEEKVK